MLAATNSAGNTLVEMKSVSERSYRVEEKKY